MIEEFTKKRLTELRIRKGISARDMSLSIGQSESYINSIENGKFMPSLISLEDICVFLKITPSEFLDEKELPQQVYTDEMGNLIKNLQKLNSDQLKNISYLVTQILKNSR